MYLSAPPHPLSGDGMAAARIPTQYCRLSSLEIKVHALCAIKCGSYM